VSIQRVYRAVLLAGAVLLILGPAVAGAQPYGTDLLSVPPLFYLKNKMSEGRNATLSEVHRIIFCVNILFKFNKI